MSQIPRSQFALKKRQNPAPMVTIPVLEFEHQKVRKAQTNGSSNGNGHKNGSFDNDVVIIESDCFAVVGHEEVVAVEETAVHVEEPSPTKKKRSRKSKDSTESKDSSKTEEAAKSPNKSQPKTPVNGAALPVEAEIAPAETKVVKLSEGLSASAQRRSDRLQNTSTIVNLSTFSSDQSTKIAADDTLEMPSERRVSGRRSTRPIDDIKFSYRTPNPDDSLNGTTNATIGSDFYNDSMLATPGTDRKRRPTNDAGENVDSPKRSRLDLSGLFSSFSSPVTMLRNKFKRANIASTPVVGGGEALMSESVVSLDESGQMQEVDLNEKEEGIEAVADNEEELKVITTPIKKRSCSIM